MDRELLGLVLVLAVVTAPLLRFAWRHGTRGTALAATLAWLAAAGLLMSVGRTPPRPGAAESTRDVRPLEVASDGYVQSDACQACHPREHASWDASFHSSMTTVATPENMLAPWDGVHYARGVAYRLEQRGDEFWVEMDDPAGPGEDGIVPRVRNRLVQITGSHHWQFFWYPAGRERDLTLLLLAYRLRDEQRWMPLDGCCMSPPHAGQATEGSRWSRVCIKCHATDARPRIESPEHVDTHVAQLGIACEACHGPGEEHALANRDPLRRYALHAAGTGDPTIVNPERLDHVRASQACGQCHGLIGFRTHDDRERWRLEGFRFVPGELITDKRDLLLRKNEDHYWGDGMIRVSGREYMGLHESPCYQRGTMSCMSCHEMHPKEGDTRSLEEWRDDQLGPGMRTNAACTQCHAEYEDEVALASHTRHGPQSSGSGCYDCHMPHTTYGLLKGIRSHMVSSPSVAETLEFGRPNACNLCHLDRTLAWTAEHLGDWFGHPKASLTTDQRTLAASVLWALEGDAAQRALVMAAWGREEPREASGTRWMSPILALLLNDPYSSVRYLAHRAALLSEDARSLAGYDFMSGHPEMERVSKVFYSAWIRNSSARNHQRGKHLLLDPAGQPQLDEIQRHLERRDDREVVLNE